jgi:hypothetical protein
MQVEPIVRVAAHINNKGGPGGIDRVAPDFLEPELKASISSIHGPGSELHRLLQPRRHAGCSSTQPRRFVISSATQRNPRWNFSFVSREEKRRHFP